MQMNENGDIIFRDIEKIKFIIKDATALDVMYAYEDLFFAEHGIFLIQTSNDKPNTLFCYFNIECSQENKLALLEKLMISSGLNGIELLHKGTFELKQKKGDETFSLIFYPKEDS